MENYTLTVLGCGVMGSAVLSSILSNESKHFPSRIICCNSSKASSDKIGEKYPQVELSYGESNVKAVAEADVIILACKPYMCSKVHAEVKAGLKNQLVISLLAGWTIDQLKIFSPYVARVMTNTPAQFGYGMAVVSISEEAEKYEDVIMSITNSVGKAIKLPEHNMDAATSLVGSGPAFCLLMMEALIDGGIKMGIPYQAAKECAVKVMEGTAKMVEITNDHPAALKSKVCTPGGTTIGGLLVMEDKGVRSGIARGVEEAAVIAARLGKK